MFDGVAVRDDVFFAVPEVPVNSVLLVRSRERALSFPLGRIELAFNPSSGFITNRVFKEDLVSYTSEYEETQAFSETFTSFHKKIADDLIERYDLRGKTIVEIGCGKGEFLTLLCELGPNRGIGFDPAYHPERNVSEAVARIEFITDFYSQKYSDRRGDFVCCKMTLEHISDVVSFVRTLRRAIGDSPETVVFFQVPEIRRILRDLAFWDIYYEHCSYFSKGSLGRLFRQEGFDVRNLWTDYDDQYLMIEASPTPSRDKLTRPLPEEDDLAEVTREVERFSSQIGPRLDAWRDTLNALHDRGKRTVLWGGGSKAVAFLTTLGIVEQVDCAVDINPYKHNTFLAKTGHKIVSPEYLRANSPDVLIIMNPIYTDEIRVSLREMNLSPMVVPIDADPLTIHIG